MQAPTGRFQTQTRQTRPKQAQITTLSPVHETATFSRTNPCNCTISASPQTWTLNPSRRIKSKQSPEGNIDPPEEQARGKTRSCETENAVGTGRPYQARIVEESTSQSRRNAGGLHSLETQDPPSPQLTLILWALTHPFPCPRPTEACAIRGPPGT